MIIRVSKNRTRLQFSLRIILVFTPFQVAASSSLGGGNNQELESQLRQKNRELKESQEKVLKFSVIWWIYLNNLLMFLKYLNQNIICFAAAS